MPTRADALYSRWRRKVRIANELLEQAYEEIDGWLQDRSDRWWRSQRGEAMQADHDRLYELLETLDQLEVLSR